MPGHAERESSMKAVLIILLAAMATLTLIAADLTGNDLAGVWKGSMNTQAGPATVTITVKPGTALTGTIQAGEYEVPISNAKISGNRVTFEMKIGFGTVAYDGIVSGDEIQFDVTGTQGDNYKLVCKRQGSKE